MIDTYFKQYFWSFHLLILAISAFLIARTVNAFVGNALATPPEAIAAAPQPGDPARPDAAKLPQPANLTAFLEKNVFHAMREDLKAQEAAAAAAAAQQQADNVSVDMNNCERSQMAAGLLGTVVAKHDEDSVAVFDDRNKKETVVYRFGEKVLDEAEIILVDARRVLVKHNGRCEMFALEEEALANAAGGGQQLAANTPPPTGDMAADGPPVESDLGKDIKKVSDTEFEIPKKEIENVLGNMNQIATQARIVPSFNNGKANGFKLFSIRPGSLYSKIGIQNGDIVQRINGYEMNSPDKALEIYSKLKDAQSITVDMIRRGKSQTLTYQIR